MDLKLTLTEAEALRVKRQSLPVCEVCGADVAHAGDWCDACVNAYERHARDLAAHDAK